MPLPDTFSGDRAKSDPGWILSLCSGEALAWSSPLIEQQSTLLSNFKAQWFHFRKGLSEAVKNELARVDTPKNLSSFIQICIKIDSRLTERREEPMQLGFVRESISREERQRRRAHQLCLYCGGKGHFAAVCPKKLRKSGSSGIKPGGEG
ncbi:hypothetical protein XELAEV_18002051mg [Xenopus laevis]|nr:hypothetical protein XELAEV_18002051mg [Xenopus laevis]